jgi:tetratricopeptide (TPR) repeat protein
MIKKTISLFKMIGIIILLNLITFHVIGQVADEDIAAQYLTNKEYEKSADMYEKLLNKNPKSVYFYDNLLKSYLGANDFNNALKLCKKQARKFENNYYFKVDIGFVYRLQKDDQKAIKIFDELISTIAPIETEVYALAKAFEKRTERANSVRTYLQGRKKINNDLLFCNELGGLYHEIGDKPKMIEEYLNVLVLDETFMNEIQGVFQNSLETKEEFEWLKQELAKKSKQYPNRNTFTEMLVWYHVQKNEYNLALTYAKSLDRKNKEEGRKMIELGFLALSNEKFDAAIEIFKQVAILGQDKPYYNLAKSNELEARSKKILQGNYSNEDLKFLVSEYQLVLKELGENPSTANTLRSLANLEAYYLNDYSNAIKHYEQIISMPRVDRILQANCKLDLADFYLMKGEVWESMLLYGQVDKDFLQDPLGQEAKLRNAKLSYYLGEFEWAKAQLDILKTATTQLIANNALELSLLIQDNTIDSNMEPLKLYANADLNYVQRNYQKALTILDSINIVYPKHTLIDDVYFKKGQIYLSQKNYKLAANYFEKIANDFSSDILGDNALYQVARIYQNNLQNPELALKSYEKFIDTYPGSFFLSDVRKQFRILRGDQLN